MSELARLQAEVIARTEAIKRREDSIVNIEQALAFILGMDVSDWE